MRRPSREFTEAEIVDLARLWASPVRDKALEVVFDRHRGVLHRKALSLGLKPRRLARLELYNDGGALG